MSLPGVVTGGIRPSICSSSTGGAELLLSVNGNRFIALPIGIEQGMTLRALRPVQFDVLDLLTGATLETRTAKPGEPFTLKGRPAVLLRGTVPLRGLSPTANH